MTIIDKNPLKLYYFTSIFAICIQSLSTHQAYLETHCFINIGYTDTHSFNFLIATHSSCSALLPDLCVHWNTQEISIKKN